MEYHQERRLQIASTQPTPLSLTSNEILIRQCAQDGDRLGQIDSRSIGRVLSEIVKKITVITGLKLDPQTSDYFSEQFTLFIKEYYSNLTPSEIITAFHLNANESGDEKVVMYGSFLTLEVVGKVLTQYRSKRAAVARKINNQPLISIEPPKPTEEEMIIERKEHVNQFYVSYLNEELSEAAELYAHQIYLYIKKYKPELLPSADIRKRFYEEAKEHRKQELMMPNKSPSERHAAREIVKQYLEGVISSTEEEKVLQEGMRRTLMYMFNEFSKQGLKKIL